HTIGELLGCHTKTVSNWRKRFEHAEGAYSGPIRSSILEHSDHLIWF
ncbi:MAG: helix-turn-helix domain-containing protein, partial [Gammaproteobacteria bacterium]|nr:helix-turn-helix domain-containing protein [Gammaproteobacteria bacterium]